MIHTDNQDTVRAHELEDAQKIKEARNRYMRQWRRENPDRVAAINRRYWLKKAEQMQQEGGEQP